MKKKSLFLSWVFAVFLMTSGIIAQEVKLAFDLISGSDPSSPQSLTVLNGKLYFCAFSESYFDGDWVGKKKIWAYDNINPPKILADIAFDDYYMEHCYYPSYPSGFGAFKNKLYFGASDDTHGLELWAHDGTNDPEFVANIHPGNDYWGSDSFPQEFAEFNNKLYFSASTFYNHEGLDWWYSNDELWEYDGINPPLRTADINPGDYGSYPRELTVFKGKLYFSAFSTHEWWDWETLFFKDNELWVYDGVNPPSEVADINSSLHHTMGPTSLTVYKDKLYFYGSSGGYNRELWAYDGINPPGIVMDVNPEGTWPSYPNSMIGFKNKLYFGASDGIHGKELWVYDGTHPPSMVADIYKGNKGSLPTEFVVFRNKLYFSANDRTHGKELWVYDGTHPPSMVADIYRGIKGSFPSDFINYNGKLYFSANNGAYGRELWVMIDKNPDQSPSVSFISPAKGATVSGKVQVKVNAMDDLGISQVNYIDGELKHTITPASMPNGSILSKGDLNFRIKNKNGDRALSFINRSRAEVNNTFTYEWDTSTYEIGKHPVGIIVYDTSGQKATARVDVIVKNTFPLYVMRYTEKSWIIKKQFGKIDISIQNPGAISAVVVYRKVGNGDNQSIKEVSPSELQGAYTFYDKYLEKDKTYTYKAEAFNATGRVIAISGEQTI